MVTQHEIRLCGRGGQGIILAGHIAGLAASIFEHKYATLIQDYGPEARGGACRADVVVSDERILYPYINAPSVLVAMSQEAYDKLIGDVKEGGLVFYDSDLVKIRGIPGINQIPVASTKAAKGLGRQMVANAVMLGAMAEGTGIMDADQLKACLKESVPAGTEELNVKAFDLGRSLASNHKRHVEK